MLNKLPQLLQDKLKAIYTDDELKIVTSGLSIESRKPSFRINKIKAHEAETIASLEEAGLKIKKIDFLENAYTLEQGREKDLWDTGAFKAGYIYMQSISSQIPVACMWLSPLEQWKWALLLDITAAPGSKTSQMAADLNNTGKIIAVDNNAIRIDKLNFTLKRQWVKNVTVIKKDARNIVQQLGETEIGNFTHILADLPCSSEWRINLDNEKSYGFWDETTNKKNYKLQKQILQEIIPLLRDGWEFMYSTCTLSPEENEAVVHFILCNYPELEIVDIADQYSQIFTALTTKPGLIKFGKQIYKNEVAKSVRILPSPQTEGFFIAKFRKKIID